MRNRNQSRRQTQPVTISSRSDTISQKTDPSVSSLSSRKMVLHTLLTTFFHTPLEQMPTNVTRSSIPPLVLVLHTAQVFYNTLLTPLDAMSASTQLKRHVNPQTQQAPPVARYLQNIIRPPAAVALLLTHTAPSTWWPTKRFTSLWPMASTTICAVLSGLTASGGQNLSPH